MDLPTNTFAYLIGRWRIEPMTTVDPKLWQSELLGLGGALVAAGLLLVMAGWLARFVNAAAVRPTYRSRPGLVATGTVLVAVGVGMAVLMLTAAGIGRWPQSKLPPDSVAGIQQIYAHHLLLLTVKDWLVLLAAALIYTGIWGHLGRWPRGFRRQCRVIPWWSWAVSAAVVMAASIILPA